MTTEKTSEFEFLPSGEIVRNKNGRPVPVATFSEDDGHLEFVSLYMDEKYRADAQRCVEQDPHTGDKSGRVVVSYGIKGRPRDTVNKSEPERPKANKMLGDKTPAIVNWFFKWRPQEAYVRYGVKLDKDGEPVRAHCKRIELHLGTDDKTGNVKQMEVVTAEDKNGMIARRQTHCTFLAVEKVDLDGDEVAIEAEANQ